MLLWLQVSWLPLLLMSQAQSPPITTDWNSDLWRDKTYKPRDRVLVSGVNNLPDDSVLVCVAYDHDKNLFVLRDGAAKIWGVAAEKLRRLTEMELTTEWKLVPPDMSVPPGAEYKIDVASGEKMARLPPAEDSSQ